MGKSCVEGVSEALMYAYDVSFVIVKDKKKSIIDFYQDGNLRSALRFGIRNDDMDTALSEEWNRSYDSGEIPNPIETKEDAEKVCEWLESNNFKVGRLVE